MQEMWPICEVLWQGEIAIYDIIYYVTLLQLQIASFLVELLMHAI